MIKNLDQFISDAGFVRFTPAEDPKQPIDWSSNYDYELKEFARLLVIECALIATQTNCLETAQMIKDRFGIK